MIFAWKRCCWTQIQEGKEVQCLTPASENGNSIPREALLSEWLGLHQIINHRGIQRFLSFFKCSRVYPRTPGTSSFHQRGHCNQGAIDSKKSVLSDLSWVGLRAWHWFTKDCHRQPFHSSHWLCSQESADLTNYVSVYIMWGQDPQAVHRVKLHKGGSSACMGSIHHHVPQESCHTSCSRMLFWL